LSPTRGAEHDEKIDGIDSPKTRGKKSRKKRVEGAHDVRGCGAKSKRPDGVPTDPVRKKKNKGAKKKKKEQWEIRVKGKREK